MVMLTLFDSGYSVKSSIIVPHVVPASIWGITSLSQVLRIRVVLLIISDGVAALSAAIARQMTEQTTGLNQSL